MAESEQDLPSTSPEMDQWLERRFGELFEQRMAEREISRSRSLCIMATKGTLDWAYPTFILASTASALGWEVRVFFTFYGLALLKRDLKPKISPLGNPAMPMKMPFGPQWFANIDWNMPNLLMAGVPGFESLATTLMKKTVASKGVAPIKELRGLCVEGGVELIACQMTADLFGWKKDEFIPEIGEWAGAASYLDLANRSGVNLFI